MAQTDIPIYSKNPVISLPNVPSNYITNSVAFSARSLTHDNGKTILICKHCKKQRHTKDQCWKLHSRPPRGMFQSLGLISVDGMNPWILDSGATDHLTGFSKHFVSYTPVSDLNSGRTIGTVRHDFMLLHFRLGPSKVTTSLGKWWFVTFIDDHTRLTWVYLITDKSEPLRGLFTKPCVPTLLNKMEWPNKKNCQLVEVARSLMLSTSLPSYLWGDAILTVAHLINRIPSRILHLQTPLDCLKESYPSTRLVSEVPLRVFGCIAYVHNFDLNQTKFTLRAQACVFIGYPLHQCSYKCFHPLSRKYFVTMDVTFCENRPYFPVSHLQGESVSE
ncbi:Retrovirus-related Pol polyprotein from transposon TNT 1-94 [Cucumis melo var. makuwa]|uniref:Retrovirus-related Pol polyprotein from transposon TNT 1-94 n=1 Tax=Cucumis melo var. makuwa TaxID=1194695 RepID=A0A5D3CCG8_CUCMM|nr:Retrovirus-related Pol polyprotein from transposon TNT 1-94 [Cucumis melo var. makuwa]